MNTVTIPSIIVDAMEAALRSAVPDEVSDSDFLAVDWRGEAEYLARCLETEEEHFTNPTLCRALGGMTAVAALAGEPALSDYRKEPSPEEEDAYHATMRSVEEKLAAGGWRRIGGRFPKKGSSEPFGAKYEKDGQIFWLNKYTASNIPPVGDVGVRAANLPAFTSFEECVMKIKPTPENRLVLRVFAREAVAACASGGLNVWLLVSFDGEPIMEFEPQVHTVYAGDDEVPAGAERDFLILTLGQSEYDRIFGAR